MGKLAHPLHEKSRFVTLGLQKRIFRAMHMTIARKNEVLLGRPVVCGLVLGMADGKRVRICLSWVFGYTPLMWKLKLTDDDWIGLFFVFMLCWWWPAAFLVLVVWKKS